jgi:hypothetical protein
MGKGLLHEHPDCPNGGKRAPREPVKRVPCNGGCGRTDVALSRAGRCMDCAHRANVASAARQDQFSSESQGQAPGAGQCQFCGSWHPVTHRGVVGQHAGPWVDGRPSGTCPGAKLPPLTPVPCISCGATGVAIGMSTGQCRACRQLAQSQPGQ